LSLKIVIKRLLASTRESGIATWYRIPSRPAAYRYRPVSSRPTSFFFNTVSSRDGTVRYGTVLKPHTAGLWNRLRNIHACTSKSPHVPRFLNIPVFSCIYMRELTKKYLYVLACHNIMYFTCVFSKMMLDWG
jgi:hypothetical protein